MRDTIKRVTLKLEVDGQTTEISRTVSSADRWSNLTDKQVIKFTRKLTKKALDALGYKGGAEVDRG